MSRWQPIASMVTIAPSIASMSSNFGIAMISLDFSAGCEGRNHVDRRSGVLLSAGQSQGLAIDGNYPLRRSGQCCDPGDEASLELLGVQDSQDVAEMVVRWRAVLERAERTQKLAFLTAE